MSSVRATIRRLTTTTCVICQEKIDTRRAPYVDMNIQAYAHRLWPAPSTFALSLHAECFERARPDWMPTFTPLWPQQR